MNVKAKLAKRMRVFTNDKGPDCRHLSTFTSSNQQTWQASSNSVRCSRLIDRQLAFAALAKTTRNPTKLMAMPGSIMNREVLRANLAS